MLRPEESEAISAWVDGESSSMESLEIEKLLTSSPEASDLAEAFRQQKLLLKDDALLQGRKFQWKPQFSTAVFRQSGWSREVWAALCASLATAAVFAIGFRPFGLWPSFPADGVMASHQVFPNTPDFAEGLEGQWMASGPGASTRNGFGQLESFSVATGSASPVEQEMSDMHRTKDGLARRHSMASSISTTPPPAAKNPMNSSESLFAGSRIAPKTEENSVGLQQENLNRQSSSRVSMGDLVPYLAASPRTVAVLEVDSPEPEAMSLKVLSRLAENSIAVGDSAEEIQQNRMILREFTQQQALASNAHRIDHSTSLPDQRMLAESTTARPPAPPSITNEPATPQAGAMPQGAHEPGQQRQVDGASADNNTDPQSLRLQIVAEPNRDSSVTEKPNAVVAIYLEVTKTGLARVLTELEQDGLLAEARLRSPLATEPTQELMTFYDTAVTAGESMEQKQSSSDQAGAASRQNLANTLPSMSAPPADYHTIEREQLQKSLGAVLPLQEQHIQSGLLDLTQQWFSQQSGITFDQGSAQAATDKLSPGTADAVKSPRFPDRISENGQLDSIDRKSQIDIAPLPIVQAVSIPLSQLKVLVRSESAIPVKIDSTEPNSSAPLAAEFSVQDRVVIGDAQIMAKTQIARGKQTPSETQLRESTTSSDSTAIGTNHARLRFQSSVLPLDAGFAYRQAFEFRPVESETVSRHVASTGDSQVSNSPVPGNFQSAPTADQQPVSMFSPQAVVSPAAVTLAGSSGAISALTPENLAVDTVNELVGGSRPATGNAKFSEEATDSAERVRLLLILRNQSARP